MKKFCPDAWWQTLHKRCPGCGKNGRRVGGSFQPPPQHDKRAWNDIAQLLQDGGKFDNCGGAAVEAERERRRGWLECWVARDTQKRRIITELKNAKQSGEHTAEEKRKSQAIRALKACSGQPGKGQDCDAETIRD